MGQKVNPHGLRVGIIKDWDSTWYADKKDYANFLVEDNKLRTFVKNKLANSSVAKVAIERTNERVKITVYTSKPGIVIGRQGSAIQELSAELQTMTSQKVMVNIEEIKRPETSSQLQRRLREDSEIPSVWHLSHCCGARLLVCSLVCGPEHTGENGRIIPE